MRHYLQFPKEEGWGTCPLVPHPSSAPLKCDSFYENFAFTVNVLVETLSPTISDHSILLYFINSFDILPKRSNSETSLSSLNSYCAFSTEILCGRTLSLCLGHYHKTKQSKFENFAIKIYHSEIWANLHRSSFFCFVCMKQSTYSDFSIIGLS